jgi:aspartyl-tRNA synthetase
LAYITEEDITSLISNLVLGLIKTIYPQKNILHTEIPHYDYDYVMEHYSIDKPDMRYGLKMYTVTDIVAQ